MKNTINIEKFVYVVVRTEHTASDGDDTSVFLFTSLKNARKWTADDIRFAVKTNFAAEELTWEENGKNYSYREWGGDSVSWEVRKLPLQTASDWTIPGYPVRYKKACR